MKTRNLLIYSALLCCSVAAMTGCKKKRNEQEITIRNVYFDKYGDGTDPYTDFIEEKFGVEITPSYYTYATWGEQVMADINAASTGLTLPDVFHFDLESFNFGNTYKSFADGGIIKALPDDLSRWPKLKALIQNASNINSLMALALIFPEYGFLTELISLMMSASIFEQYSKHKSELINSQLINLTLSI